MKKLKLNKQTISVLGNEGQKRIIGGGMPTELPCETGQGGCQNFTKDNNCGTKEKDCYLNTSFVWQCALETKIFFLC